MLFNAPVKNPKRMAVKVAAYREEAELDALVELIFKRYRESSGKENEQMNGVEGLQAVASWLDIAGHSDLKLGPLARACAEAMQLERPPSNKWPHVQQVGDCLRCTIECPDVQSMLRTWRRLREVFKIREGRGRLKNNLLNMKIPPDMLVRDG